MPQTDEITQLVHRAQALARTGQLPAALEALEAVSQLDPDSAIVREQIGFVHFQMGQFDEAIAAFQAVTRLDPKRASAYVNMGAIYNKLGNFSKALECLRRGIAMDKKSPDAFYNLGIAHRKLKQYSMAVPAYKECIRLNPQMAEAYQNLGNVYFEMGSHQQAMAQFRKALELKPDFERAKRGLEKADAAIAASRKIQNPFGRLVKLPDDGNQGVDDRATRELNDEDREHDRHVLFQLSEEWEAEVDGFIEMLKTRLGPALRDLSRSVAGDTTVDFVDAHEQFRRVVAEFAPRTKRLGKLSDHLKSHEEQQHLLP